MRAKALAFLVLLLFSTASADPVYNVIDLGTLGGNRSYAYSINDNSKIVDVPITLQMCIEQHFLIRQAAETI